MFQMEANDSSGAYFPRLSAVCGFLMLSAFSNAAENDLREMSTDRPDTTESPITVDAGHLQIESSLFDYSLDDEGGIRQEIFTYGALNLKFGLTSQTDLQLVFDSFTSARTHDKTTGVSTTVEGFSDVQARFKFNVWGNDGGSSALAIFPFVKIPTGTAVSNRVVEGGVIVPFAMDLTDRLGLGLMAEADFVRSGPGADVDTEFVHTAVLGIDITDSFGAFVEYVGTAGNFAYQAQAIGGLTYSVTDDLRLDGGLRIGLNDAAEDFGAFFGASVRF